MVACALGVLLVCVCVILSLYMRLYTYMHIVVYMCVRTSVVCAKATMEYAFRSNRFAEIIIVVF